MKSVSFLFFLPCISSLNILIYSPSIGYSHLNYHAKLADVLMDAGHNVVTVVNELNVNLKMAPTKSEVITIPADPKTIAIQDAGEKSTLVGFWVSEYDDVWSAIPMFEEITNMADTQCGKALNYPGLMIQLEEHNFDVGISEPWDMCGFGIFHQLNITKYAITMTNVISESISRIIGVPVATSWVPGAFVGLSSEMTISERFLNLQAAYISNRVSDTLLERQHKTFAEKFGDDFPSFKEILANASLVFTNSDPYLDFPKPTIHKVIDLGGIAVPKKSNNLTEYWDEVLSRRARTILISFGTVAKAFAMPNSFKTALLATFDEFPDVTFIWKYEKNDNKITDGHDNVVISKWLPQSALLSDDRVTAFITHCGAGSVNEAAARGKPMLAIPLFADQMRNARMVERVGIAIRFDKKDLADVQKLVVGITELLENEKYQLEAARVSKMLADRPFSPAQSFVRNIEFVGKYGPLTILDPHSRRMGWIEYLNLDLVLLTFLAIFISLFLVALCLCTVCLIYTKKKEKKYRKCNDDDFFLS